MCKAKSSDYPFTTLHPGLAVVSVSSHKSFIMADIPVLSRAPQQAGLGHRFPKNIYQEHAFYACY